MKFQLVEDLLNRITPWSTLGKGIMWVPFLGFDVFEDVFHLIFERYDVSLARTLT